MRKLALATFALALSVASAFAQNVAPGEIPHPGAGAYNAAPPTCTAGQYCTLQTDANGQLKIVGSISASLSGFPTVQTTGTPISVTTGGVTGTLPAGAVVVASNVGSTNTAYCKLGASATVNDQPILPGSWFAFTVGANTQLTCITSTSTTTVNQVGGSGLPTGAGGGAGGGGSSSITNWGGGVLGAMANYGTSPGAVLVPGINAFVTNTLAAMANNADDVAASTANVSPVGSFPFLWDGTNWDRWKSAGATGVAAVRQSDGTNVAQINPCQSEVQTTVPFTLATAAVKVAITGVSAKKIYVCAYDLNNNAADSVAIFEATTATTCATAAVAVIGAGTSVATAATGYNWSANGGVSRGAGGFQVMQTSVNANDLCIAQSAATQLSGTFTYVTR